MITPSQAQGVGVVSIRSPFMRGTVTPLISPRARARYVAAVRSLMGQPSSSAMSRSRWLCRN